MIGYWSWSTSVIHVVFVDQRASSEACAVCNYSRLTHCGNWSLKHVVGGDWWYLTKLRELKSMHIGTVQSEWCLYSSYKLFVVHLNLGLAPLARSHYTLNPARVAKLWLRQISSELKWELMKSLTQPWSQLWLFYSYPAPQSRLSTEESYFRPHPAWAVLAWMATSSDAGHGP